jgi:hypothetical protein
MNAPARIALDTNKLNAALGLFPRDREGKSRHGVRQSNRGPQLAPETGSRTVSGGGSLRGKGTS